jgi:hypothetical protein
MWRVDASVKAVNIASINDERPAFAMMEDPGDLAQAQQSAETERTGAGGAPYSADFYIYSFKVINARAP